MSAKTRASNPNVLRVSEAAVLADVSEDTVMRWIKAGHLRVFVRPGSQIGDSQRGPKSIRILRSDWQAFLEANTAVGFGGRIDVPERPRVAGAAASAPAQKHRNRNRSTGPA